MAALDFLGRKIAVGDYVVYPVRAKSKMWLNKIRVTQIGPEGIAGYNEVGRRVSVQNLGNTVVVQPVHQPASQEASN